METIRMGIIGIGNIGSAHAYSLWNGKVTGVQLQAVCDVSESRLAWCRDCFPNVLCFQDWKELLTSGEIDAVLIAVPHPLHAQMAKVALQQGLHVLSEKPIDIRVSQARELNECAKRSNKVFAVMFNQRTNELFAKARQIVQSGQLGELKRSVWIITNWYRTQHYYDSGDWRATWSGEGGGVLINQAPHNLDLWQWICGMPTEITASCEVGKYHNIEVEDDVTIFARYANGATGVFVTSTGEYPGTNRLEISGSLGKLVLENNTLKWWKLSRSEREWCMTLQDNSIREECEYMEFVPQTQETGHIGIIQNFVDAILHGTPLLSPGLDGICELMISNAAYLSSWTGGKKVSLPVDEVQFDKLLLERIQLSERKELVKNQEKGGQYVDRWKVNW